MGQWGIQPGDFWQMTPSEWWRIYNQKHPPKQSLDEDGLAELYELIE